jgi:hypothetical protein
MVPAISAEEELFGWRATIRSLKLARYFYGPLLLIFILLYFIGLSAIMPFSTVCSDFIFHCLGWSTETVSNVDLIRKSLLQVFFDQIFFVFYAPVFGIATTLKYADIRIKISEGIMQASSRF